MGIGEQQEAERRETVVSPERQWSRCLSQFPMILPFLPVPIRKEPHFLSSTCKILKLLMLV